MPSTDKGFEQAVIDGIIGQLPTLATSVAQQMGTPPGAKRYSQQEQDEQWNFSPIADPRTRAETMIQLKALGKSNEEITDAIYPNRRRLVETGRPDHTERIRFARQMKARMARLATEMLEARPQAQETSLSPIPTAPSLPSVPQMGAPPASPSPSALDQPANLEAMP
jgi:hypothetical protein